MPLINRQIPTNPNACQKMQKSRHRWWVGTHEQINVNHWRPHAINPEHLGGIPRNMLAYPESLKIAVMRVRPFKQIGYERAENWNSCHSYCVIAKVPMRFVQQKDVRVWIAFTGSPTRCWEAVGIRRPLKFGCIPKLFSRSMERPGHNIIPHLLGHAESHIYDVLSHTDGSLIDASTHPLIRSRAAGYLSLGRIRLFEDKINPISSRSVPYIREP